MIRSDHSDNAERQAQPSGDVVPTAGGDDGDEAPRHDSVDQVLDHLDRLARSREQVSIGNVVEAFGRRGYGPFLMIPALIEVSPIGGIPGFPTFLAFLVSLFAIQIVFGRDHFWLPDFVERQTMASKRLSKGVKASRPLARFLDRWFYGRIGSFTTAPFIKLAAALCILLCLTVPPLEIIPFASTLPFGTILIFGLSILVRDGALMIAALSLTLVSIATFLHFLMRGSLPI